MISRKYCLMMAIMISACMAAYAPGLIALEDGPELRVRIDNDRVYIGDPIRYTIEMRSPGELAVKFPAPKKEGGDVSGTGSDISASPAFGDFEVRSSRSYSNKKLFGGWVYGAEYTLATYLTGKKVIPGSDVEYRRAGTVGAWSSKKAPELVVDVQSVLPKDALQSDIKDIKAPISPKESSGLVLKALIIMLIAAAAAGMFFITKRPAKKKSFYQEAVDRLDMCKKALDYGGNPKDYYVGVSDTVRAYIESVFDLRAPEMTTEEFLHSPKTRDGLLGRHQDVLGRFLESSDLVKFAKYSPVRDEAEGLYASAKDFIEATKEKAMERSRER